MKSKNIKILLIIFTMFIAIKDVSASSISVNANTSSITKGNTITISATVSADAEIYTIEGSVSCQGAGTSGGIDLNYEDMDTKYKSKTFSFTIKPTSSGTVTCSSSNVKIRELSQASIYQLTNDSVNITVNEPAVVAPKTYSSNNYLSSLSIEGYDISPSFSKDVTEYKITLDESIEKINIKATPSDNSATISGTGEKNITSGENVIEIKVEAENGNEKIYKIVVTVEDQHPITIEIDKNKYTLIKKNNNILETPKLFEENTLKIDNQDVICYKNNVSNLTLVILKNEEGVSNYYVYDEQEKTYTLYNELNISGKTLYLMELTKKELPSTKYKKYTFTYQDKELEGYKITKDSNFYLIYAMNIETGKTSLYTYDKEESTIQRYNKESNNYPVASITNGVKNYQNYFYITLGLLGLISVSFIVYIIIKFIKKKRK